MRIPVRGAGFYVAFEGLVILTTSDRVRVLPASPPVRPPHPNDLGVEDALRAYARMMNRLSLDELEPLLADDFHYSSQWVTAEITSKQEFLEYMGPKLVTIRQAGNRVWAEMARLPSYPKGPCLVMAQGSEDNLIATLLVQVSAGRIKRADLCMIPDPRSAVRTGEYPR